MTDFNGLLNVRVVRWSGRWQPRIQARFRGQNTI